MYKKRGQATGGGAAVLVALIGAFLILYVLFLPPDVREDLLGINKTGATAGIPGETANILLKESPGTLYMNKQDSFEHRIDPLTLYVKFEDKVLSSVDSAYISRSRTEAKHKKIILILDKPTSNVNLAFNAEKHSGRLIILVNDEEVYNAEANGNVAIRLDNLQDKNIIEFQAQNIGWMFWATNFYQLTNIKVVGTIENRDNQEATSTFFVDATEAANINSAYLTYYVICKSSDMGKLQVSLNGKQISNTVPDCGSPVKVVLSPDDIRKGTNELRFSIESGSYLLDQIFVKTQLTEPSWPVYYFDVNNTIYRKIANNSVSAIMTMKFLEDGKLKQAKVILNDRPFYIETKTSSFTKTVNNYIENGPNAIQIQPLQTTLNVIQLKIHYE